MGIGSSDLTIKVEPLKIPVKFLKPVPEVNTHRSSPDAAIPALKKALADLKDEIAALQPPSNKLGTDIKMLQSKKDLINQLLNGAKKSQTRMSQDFTALSALQPQPVSGSIPTGVASNILQRLKST